MSGTLYQFVVASSQKLLDHSMVYSVCLVLGLKPMLGIFMRQDCPQLSSGFQTRRLFSNDNIGEKPSYNPLEFSVGTVFYLYYILLYHVYIL
jgi:hypothetical protein